MPSAATPARLLLAALVLLAGCAAGPSFKPPNPQLPGSWPRSPSRPAAPSTIDAGAGAAVEWWTSFGDATLSDLIARATQANLDVRTAMLRVEEARAQHAIDRGGLWPELSANASFARQRLSVNTPNGAVFGLGSSHIPGLPAGIITNPFNQYQLGLSTTWELDLFGRTRRALEADTADTAGAVENGRDVLVSLMGQVSSAYIDLRGAQLRQKILDESLTTQRDLLELTRARHAAGLTSELDVANAQAELDATTAQLPPLEDEITQDVNLLSRLLDREPGALGAELEAVRPIPPVPATVPVGLPAELARRRPDIRHAEASLHAATARIGVAVADLYPQITLTASGGFQAEGLARLLETASHFGSVGPGLDLPVFDTGRRVATVHLQKLKAQEAAVDYARTVLGALHEAANAMSAYGTEQQRRSALSGAVEASRDALTLARDRYESGVTSFIDVLDAQRTLQQNELALATSTTVVSSDLVQLYKALGGGWQVSPGPSPGR
jgi:outer membrane protein, multidrug efflux system